MSDKEMRELDAWIAAHVMGWVNGKCRNDDEFHISSTGSGNVFANNCLFQPTVDPAAAMLVLKKCMTQTAITLGTEKDDVKSCGDKADLWGREEASTLELAICLFAKRLFSK